MDQQGRTDEELTALAANFSGYEVQDQGGGVIGNVEDLFVDENDRPEYVGVGTGLLGTKKTLIPLEAATLDEANRRVVVAADGDRIRNGPAYDSDADLTPEFEERVYAHYGLTRAAGSSGYGTAPPPETTTGTTSGTTSGTASGTVAGLGSGGTDDELRVRRSEEELRAGTREREAGTVNVRKRVRTDRERVEVPVKREEVTVERVPVNEEGSGTEIGDDEVVVPVVKEEVVVDKRAVVKEEVRLRKDVVEDTEVVEEDVRREEVDVEDATTTRRRTDTDV